MNESSRGVSEVIGFVLFFAVVILFLSLWQAFIIPSDTTNAETDHQLTVEGDLQDLRDTLELSRQAENRDSVRVQLGPDYQDRLLFSNPPRPAGSIQTVAEDGKITISNATVDEGEPVGTARFWSENPRTVDTALLTYDVRYNELGYDPSYTLENSFLYGDLNGEKIGLTDQSLIDGTDIRLTSLLGTVSENHNDKTSIRVQSNSPARRSVTVESDGEPITLRFPTRLDQSELETFLEGSGSEYVESVAVDSGENHDTAVIKLDETQTYDVELAAVSVGHGIESPEPAYLASATGNKTVYAAGSQRLTAEVRDEFDNVLADENVTFSADHGQIEVGGRTDDDQTVSTGKQGTARVRYVAPNQVPPEEDTVTISHRSEEVASIEVTIDLRSTGVQAESDVRWDDESIELFVGESRELVARDYRGFDSAPVLFDVQNRSTLEIQESDEQFEDDEARLTVEAKEASDNIYAYVSSFSDGDRLPIEILYSDWVWETVADWAEGSNNRTVTDDVGDREADTVRLGYTPVEEGLVGYWPFDEESGDTANDASGTGNGGDHEGSPTLGEDGILSSTKYTFDGENDYVRVPHDESLEMSSEDAVSVSMWVNQNQDRDREWTALLQKSDTSFNLQLNDNNEPVFTIHDGDWQTTISGVSLNQDQWYHLVGTYDGNEARIYVDGQLKAAENVSGSMTDASDFDIGIGENLDVPNRHFDGQIDEVRLYNRGISQQEVASLYQTSQDGIHTAGWKTGPRTLDSDSLRLTGTDFDLNGGTVTVTVESRVDGQIETSDPIQLTSGADEYDVTGIETDSDEFRLLVEFETDDVSQTPVVSRLELVDDGPEEASLRIDEFDVGDKYNVQDFETEITVTEENNTETFEFELTFEVRNSDDQVVYTETIDRSDTGELSGESETITFGEDYDTDRLGPFQAGEYTATVTADASNTDEVTEGSEFTVEETWINYQPPEDERDGETPDGYLADEGERFGDRGDGLRYGWIEGDSPEDNAEYRERGTDDDQRKDTLIHMDQESVAGGIDWEIDVADGVYDLRIVMGDPDHTDQNNTIRVGDEILVDEEGVGGSNFIVHETTVTVTEGKLRIEPVDTVDSGGGSSDLGNQKLNYIELTKSDDPYFDVTIDDVDNEVMAGDKVTVEYTVENTGDGSDIQNIDFNVDDENEDTEADVALDPSETFNGSFIYPTDEEDVGEITVEVSSEDESDIRTVTVEEESSELTTRVDDLTHVRDDNTMFLTSVSITEESENFERIEVVHQSVDNSWAEAEDSIDSPRGSVFYEEGGTAEDTYEITIRVIHSEDGEDVVAAERTISAVSNASNPIEEDVSLSSSPQIDESDILDRSNPWDGARYRISYEIEQTVEYDETRLFLISTEDGGFDDDTESDMAATIDLETDGYGEEYKISALVVDDEGVVVDSRTEFDRAEETSAGNTEVVSSSSQEPDLPGINPDSELAFGLEKDGPSDVTVEGIAFEETSSDATVIEASDQGFSDGDAFIRSDTDTVLRSDPILLGSGETDVSSETFQQWEEPEFVFTQFRDEDGNQIDLNGESVTIRLYYSDESSRLYKLTG